MNEPALHLRDAEGSDMELIFRWANDPITRRASFSTTEIAWTEHQSWFQEKLTDDRCLFFVVEEATREPVAQVRFDLEGSRAVISISVSPAARDRGIGSQAIGLATTEAARRARLTQVHAYIKPTNEASVRAFRRAGYGEPVSVEHAGAPALRMTWPR